MAPRPQPLLSDPLLAELNQRRSGPAWRQLLGHGALLLTGGLLWGWPTLPLPLRLVGLLLLAKVRWVHTGPHPGLAKQVRARDAKAQRKEGESTIRDD